MLSGTYYAQNYAGIIGRSLNLLLCRPPEIFNPFVAKSVHPSCTSIKLRVEFWLCQKIFDQKTTIKQLQVLEDSYRCCLWFKVVIFVWNHFLSNHSILFPCMYHSTSNSSPYFPYHLISIQQCLQIEFCFIIK